MRFLSRRWQRKAFIWSTEMVLGATILVLCTVAAIGGVHQALLDAFDNSADAMANQNTNENFGNLVTPGLNSLESSEDGELEGMVPTESGGTFVQTLSSK